MHRLFPFSGLRRQSIVYAAAVLLLAVHIFLLAGFCKNSFYTFDEPVHMAGGLEILHHADFNITLESGVLPQVLSALPLLSAIPSMPPVGTLETTDRNPVIFARSILFAPGLDPQLLLARSRLLMSLLSVLAAVSVFFAARKFAGPVHALAALALYSFFPVFLSNGPLATSDMCVSLFYLTSALFTWRLFRRISILNFLLAGISVSLLFLSKMSALLVIPAIGLLLLCLTFSSVSVRIDLPRLHRRLLLKHHKFCALSAVCVLEGVLLFGAIWTGYAFQRDMPTLPDGVALFRNYELTLQSASRTLPGKLILATRVQHLLPKPYLTGFLSMFQYSYNDGKWNYLNGKASTSGSVLFFPLLFLYKTPPPVILAYFLAAVFLAASLFKPDARRRTMLCAPYLIFTLVYLTAALSSSLNIGYRHLMPALLVFLPCTAFGFRRLTRLAPIPRFPRLTRWTVPIPALLCLWCVADVLLSCMPHYTFMAYFSPCFGGPSQARRYIADSSLDWGQDVMDIRPAFLRHNIPLDGSRKIFTALFTSVPLNYCNRPLPPSTQPLRYSGIPGPDELLFDFKPGYYVFSSTILSGISANPQTSKFFQRPDLLVELKDFFYDALERRNTGNDLSGYAVGTRNNLALIEYQAFRLEILRRALVKRRPLFQIDHSICVYHLSEAQLKQILKDLLP